MPSHMARARRAATFVLLAVAAACTSTTSTVISPSPTAQAAQVAAATRTDAHVLGVLHETNRGEIAAGTLAQQRGTDSAVKAFAAMMVTEHTTLDQQGSTMAEQMGATPTLPDSTLPRIQNADAAALSAATAGAGFDRLYIMQQVIAHQRTLNLVDASIGVTQRAELKTMLQNQVRPAVAGHLTQAQSIQARIGQP